MRIGDKVFVDCPHIPRGAFEGIIAGISGQYYLVRDFDDKINRVYFFYVHKIENHEAKLEACDLIEELLKMLRSKTLTQEESDRLNEIEDFSVNYLGED